MQLIEGCVDSDWKKYESLPLVKDFENLTVDSRTFYRSFKKDANILPCRITHVPFINSLRICASLNCTYGDFGYADHLLRYLYNRNKINFKNNTNGNRLVYVSKFNSKKYFWTKFKRILAKDVDILYGYNVLILLDNFTLDELFNLLIKCDSNVYFEGSFQCLVQTRNLSMNTDRQILDQIIDDIYKLPIYYEFVRTPFKSKKNILEDNKCAICKEITTNVSYVKSYCRISDEIQAMEFICTSCISENMGTLEIGFMQDCHIPEQELLAKIKDVTVAEIDAKEDVVYKFSRAIPLSFLGVTNTLIINHDENGTNKNINIKMNISSGNPAFCKLLELLKTKISKTHPKILDYPFSNNLRLWPSFKACSHKECIMAETNAKMDEQRRKLITLFNNRQSLRCNRYITYITDETLLNRKQDGVFQMDVDTLKMISNCSKQTGGYFYLEMPLDQMQMPSQIILLSCELTTFRLSHYNQKNFIMIGCPLTRLIFGAPVLETDTIENMYHRMLKYNVPQSEVEESGATATPNISFAETDAVSENESDIDSESMISPAKNIQELERAFEKAYNKDSEKQPRKRSDDEQSSKKPVKKFKI